MSQADGSGWQPSRLEKVMWLLFVILISLYAVLFGVSPLKLVPIVVIPVAILYLLYRIATR